MSATVYFINIYSIEPSITANDCAHGVMNAQHRRGNTYGARRRRLHVTHIVLVAREKYVSNASFFLFLSLFLLSKSCTIYRKTKAWARSKRPRTRKTYSAFDSVQTIFIRSTDFGLVKKRSSVVVEHRNSECPTLKTIFFRVISGLVSIGWTPSAYVKRIAVTTSDHE